MADILQEKSYNFAPRIVKLSEYLNNEKKEFVLSKKILDSGTNIDLLIEEGKQGENRADFIQKYSVANKEALKYRTASEIFAFRLHGATRLAHFVPSHCQKKYIAFSVLTF